jgi:dihydropteroate synthase
MTAPASLTSGWRCRDRVLALGPQTLVMGILNVTPDSFSDGGRFLDRAVAVAHARRMVEAGADIIDVGGESTRPGAEPVPEGDERRRVVPVIAALAAGVDVALSVDTTKAGVAEAAIEAGATIVNDVSALRADPAMAGVIAGSGAGAVLMHMLGEPRTMQRDPRYGDVVAEVAAFLVDRAEAAQAAGIGRECIVVDPGLGFGKTYEHNLALLQATRQLAGLGYPLLVGPSRKNAIAAGMRLPVGERVELTAAAVGWAVAHGAAAVRVHDVREMVRVARMTEAIRDAPLPPSRAPGGRDRIVIAGLRVFGHHGVHDWERANGQEFVVDLEARLDLRAAGQGDDLARTVDYSALAAEATAIVSGERYRLIEALAERLAGAVLGHPEVVTTVVRVAKPAALADRGASQVFVEIERGR